MRSHAGGAPGGAAPALAMGLIGVGTWGFGDGRRARRRGRFVEGRGPVENDGFGSGADATLYVRLYMRLYRRTYYDTTTSSGDVSDAPPAFLCRSRSDVPAESLL